MLIMGMPISAAILAASDFPDAGMPTNAIIFIKITL
jgi:hypothetical protein